MLTKELLKQVRQIEIRTKGLVNQIFSGEYHSVFKGRGMAFSEVREYQFGDDIRNIDWNVTARFGHPFIKVFEEERELTVILLVDLSGSQFFGSIEKTKQQITAELSAILAFAALKNNDKVGLILFSDRVEKFVAPRKGRKHVLRIIRDLLSFEPKGRGTNIKNALEFLNHSIKKKSIVFLISDFADDNYEKILKIISRKHDFVSITINDPRENEIPKVGLIKLQDAETGEIRIIDTSNKEFQSNFMRFKNTIKKNRDEIFRKNKIDFIDVNTNESYIKPIVNFFRTREKRW